MTSPARRLQPADMGANEGLWVAAEAVDGSSRPLQTFGRTIDAFVTCNIHNIAVCGARPRRGAVG